MIEGVIMKAISGFYYVDTDDRTYECKARGIFRKNKITPLVGDRVSISLVDDAESKGIIEEIRDRKTELIRPPVANIDKVLITFSVKEPSPNFLLLDRFIVFSEKENLDIVIVISKTDLDVDDMASKIRDEYSRIGYKVILVNNKTGEGMDTLKEEMKKNISAFAGQSGVGKSSIINYIFPSMSLDTNEISKKLGRGRHTTRHAEIYKLDDDIMIADTPGFSSFEISDIEIEELGDYFIEFEKYDDCRFGSKCIHKNEPGCGVKEAVLSGEISSKRYENYLQILDEINNSKGKLKRRI